MLLDFYIKVISGKSVELFSEVLVDFDGDYLFSCGGKEIIPFFSIVSNNFVRQNNPCFAIVSPTGNFFAYIFVRNSRYPQKNATETNRLTFDPFCDMMFLHTKNGENMGNIKIGNYLLKHGLFLAP